MKDLFKVLGFKDSDWKEPGQKNFSRNKKRNTRNKRARIKMLDKLKIGN